MFFVGIDIGSTASKVIIMDETQSEILHKKVVPSGWNSKETGELLLEWVKDTIKGEEFKVVATGYGRVSLPYADKTITEITCHAKGAYFLCKKDIVVMDIGGQDTKVIEVKDGMVNDFIMNDKCSAGTGKFLEIMANKLGLTLQEMFEYARSGKDLKLSSTCTVFAESEVISLMGKGTPREDISKSVINQVVQKVIMLLNKKNYEGAYYLTGGLSQSQYVVEELEKNLKSEVLTNELGRFAGAIGACLMG